MVFIFPWAIVFGSHEINTVDPRWGALSLTEMFIFLGILILGLAYVWAKGDLNWIKPKPVTPIADTSIPQSLYEKLNADQSAYQVKAFRADPQPAATATGTAATTDPPPIKRPMFKPTFKKPGNE
jgi:NADH-quinone oxidoreductase subunit A